MCSSVELSKHCLDVDPQAHQEHLVSFAIDVVRQLVVGPFEGGWTSLHELEDLLFGYLHFAPFLHLRLSRRFGEIHPLHERATAEPAPVAGRGRHSAWAF